MGKPFPPIPANFPKRGVYRHFRTGEAYAVLSASFNAETEAWDVLYQKMDDPMAPQCHRSIENFIEVLVVDGERVPRFTLL